VSIFFYPNVQGFRGNGNGGTGSGTGSTGSDNGSGNGNGNGNGSTGLFGDSTALVNTYSYYTPRGGEVGIENLIRSFLTTNFPGTFNQQ